MLSDNRRDRAGIAAGDGDGASGEGIRSRYDDRSTLRRRGDGSHRNPWITSGHDRTCRRISALEDSWATMRHMTGDRGRGRVAVLIACAAGLLHAASSLYWALGGRWLLPTVGEWAVAAVERSPLQTGILLGAIGVVKALAAVIPVAVDAGRIGWTRFWRAVCWIGAVIIAVYGAVNIVVSAAVLLGMIRPDGGHDEAAMLGHVFLWDPLFLVWGVALIAWLRLSATPRHGRPAHS